MMEDRMLGRKGNKGFKKFFGFQFGYYWVDGVIYYDGEEEKIDWGRRQGNCEVILDMLKLRCLWNI